MKYRTMKYQTMMGAADNCGRYLGGGTIESRSAKPRTVVVRAVSPLTLSLAFAALVTIGAAPVAADEQAALVAALEELSPNVLAGDRRAAARESLARDLRLRIQHANDASRTAWNEIDTVDAWRRFRDQRVEQLRAGLGRLPSPPERVLFRVTGTIDGDGYVVDNVAYESRPGWWVTANLYRPTERPASLAGFILSHSHHAPKHQRELQDMGATWARAGCYVLVPDHVGHGERGQHGFISAGDYPREFRVGRQDYYFRYDSSVQLYLLGDSLMGWMAWDLMRGVDVLLAQPNIDREKIVMLGGVAGGGDPCAVAAALDERVACAAPFNFGGPQPETRYPLPDDAETRFNYAGGGSWESTRNLAYSAQPGHTFLPWEIVASIAPRRLVYGHEFAWDRQRDPVWKRFERVWGFHDAGDRLAFAHGRGELRGSPPEATHCGNIGAEHRVEIHKALERWFGIEAKEFSRPRSADRLSAMTTAADEELQPRKLHELLAATADERLAVARKRRDAKSLDEARDMLGSDLARILGNVDPPAVDVASAEHAAIEVGATTVAVERVVLETERDQPLPLIVLAPIRQDAAARPAVLCLSQSGKTEFLARRSTDVSRLVAAGCVVCLADVRDTGETAADDSRGQYSASTYRAATALMIGDPLLAQQLRDARTVLAFLHARKDVDGARIGVWGASLAAINAADVKLRVPRRIGGRPDDVEPLGGTLALLAAVYDDRIAAVCVDRGLVAYRGVLERPFTYVPLESIPPGLLTYADVSDLVAAVAPRPMLLRECVDAANRRVEHSDLEAHFRTAIETYARENAAASIVLADGASPGEWLVERLTTPR